MRPFVILDSMHYVCEHAYRVGDTFHNHKFAYTHPWLKWKTTCWTVQVIEASVSHVTILLYRFQPHNKTVPQWRFTTSRRRLTKFLLTGKVAWLKSKEKKDAKLPSGP